MKISEAREVITIVAQEKIKVAIMIEGSMGVGKSFMVKEIAETLGLEYIDLRLAQQEPGDLIGIPRVRDGKTVWGAPEWWPENNHGGILCLEELNRAPTDVRQAIFQLVTEWRLHTHVLPESWIIVSCINPEIGEYQVESLDPAMVRRFCWIKLTLDVKEWLVWADRTNLNQDFIDFISLNQSLLSITEDWELSTKPTPASYEMLDRLYLRVPENLRFEISQGCIGREAAVALSKYIKGELEPFVKGPEVLNHYSDYREKIGQQPNDAMYATILSLVVSCENGITEDQADNLATFLMEVGREQAVAVIKYLEKNLDVQSKLVRRENLRDMIKRIETE